MTVIYDNGPKYFFEDFKPYASVQVKKIKEKINEPSTQPLQSNKQCLNFDNISDSRSIDDLQIPDSIKNLIKKGNDGSYASRSEADMAVILMLVNKGLNFNDIKSIFLNYPIGEKYRSHESRDDYLKHNIEKAKEFSNLTEEEMQNPLFFNNAITKIEKEYHLDVVKFQEFIMKKYNLKYLSEDQQFFRYNGYCYENIKQDLLNNICQKELKELRKLFGKSKFTEFIHFSIGADFVEDKKAYADQVRYLTLKNGLFDLDKEVLIPHSPDFFTLNLLPYGYEPDAKCPTFDQYLKDVFNNNPEMIEFVQEIVGYAFHKSIPTPTLFFLIGSGSNGKTVFINTITSLIGEENTCSISLSFLSKEYYILGLYGKMINVSTETPRNRLMNTDIVKAVVSGDWVSGRQPYQKPTMFKPFAKHYLAMNEMPQIDDSSYGMWRRIFPIEFPRTFSDEEMDECMTEKLQKELSGIFNWALEGYKRLKDRMFKFKKIQSIINMKQLLKNNSNSVSAFESQCLMKSDVKNIKFSEVYNEYKAFCSIEGFKDIYIKSEFRKMLEAVGYKIGNDSKNNNQVTVFGVAFFQIQQLSD